MTHKTLVWFRNDLRLDDNPALHFACQAGDVLPVFIFDTDTPDEYQLGGASRWWLQQSLTSLNQSLGHRLVIRAGSAKTLLAQLIDEFGCDQLVWNRGYEPWQMQRDRDIKAELSTTLRVKSFNGSLLWEPHTVLKRDGSPYRVFTPYFKKGCLNAPPPRQPIAQPETINCLALTQADSLDVDKLDLIDDIGWHHAIAEHWQPGEKGAHQRLDDFVAGPAERYKIARDVPSLEGTSFLSPHLHFGEISPNRVWYQLHDNFAGFDRADIASYLTELGWREFSYYLLYYFPTLPSENFNNRFDHFAWQQNATQLARWQRGQTGIPIVDAGMRQLWQTGYMHNRVRMITASFLVKNLLLDWRLGAQWFWDTLVDADLASNSASWQWVAGCGADAAPYFRIFNPVLQGEKFDTEGAYVKQYCPELAALPKKYLHQPWSAPAEVLQAANIELGRDYPEPLVDLKQSRQRALDAFAALKQLG
ncbi:cryptochrome/photolyase family protein [Reinekea thalattae]|uniref:Deoxyribodipyrimidine photo-lyase n=1 Tax=Reinekea thalattae TaxID=2593301 RepID=A0A5C8Z3N4_9GAMM|nr:deoxyribodipyrimidine photo-lyase [Reinekea thalattae]TXR51924.1 deoxyribodipyrimidine photo-lyase [Reinekea thalattae]